MSEINKKKATEKRASMSFSTLAKLILVVTVGLTLIVIVRKILVAFLS